MHARNSENRRSYIPSCYDTATGFFFCIKHESRSACFFLGGLIGLAAAIVHCTAMISLRSGHEDIVRAHRLGAA
jgi:hypothetical protein